MYIYVYVCICGWLNVAQRNFRFKISHDVAEDGKWFWAQIRNALCNRNAFLADSRCSSGSQLSCLIEFHKWRVESAEQTERKPRCRRHHKTIWQTSWKRQRIIVQHFFYAAII